MAGFIGAQGLFQPTESWAVSERADVHQLEVVQAILEVGETNRVSIHHFRLITAATKILIHYFPIDFLMKQASARPSICAAMPSSCFWLMPTAWYKILVHSLHQVGKKIFRYLTLPD
jgi:hypothetical protein